LFLWGEDAMSSVDFVILYLIFFKVGIIVVESL